MKPRMSRRTLMVAALGLVAAASLASCRVEQGAALFVGDTRITDTQIDKVVDSVPTDLIIADPTEMSTSFGGVRTDVVQAMVTVELGKQVAADKSLEPNSEILSQTRDVLTKATGLPADNAYVALMSEAESYMELLKRDAKPTLATPEDVTAAAQNFAKGQGAQLAPEEQKALGEQLDTEQGRQLIGQRVQLNTYLQEYKVTANPRYGSLALTVFLFQDQNTGKSFPLLTAPVPN